MSPSVIKLKLVAAAVSLMLAMIFSTIDLAAQTKVSLQVKTFDQNLKPLPNIEIAFNNLDFFPIGSKGTAIVELNSTEIPIKSVRIKNETMEAASWNLAKGTIEIIVRPLSYKVMHVTANFADGTPLANSPVKFHGSTSISVTTDQSGKFELPISIYETVQSSGQFEAHNVLVSDMTISGDNITLLIERPIPKQQVPQQSSVKKLADPVFDVNRLDSIRSLAEFYAVFRSISINNLDPDVRTLVDAKFQQLVAQRQDSIRASQQIYIKDISDTSLVVEDIRNLLKQASAESTTLRKNREEFEDKIVVISTKLRRGVTNLSTSERNDLLRDIDMLEQLLTENESQFYKNHNDYREIINTLRENYLEVEQLQNRLTEAERLSQEQNREFRQRLFGIGGVVVVFGFLIILLISFSTRSRRQAKSLRAANERIEQINENLEEMVARRTHLLEEANKELDTFLYKASHDLRSPVLSMLGLCQIIDYIDRKEMVDHVRLATSNMDRIINKLVDISEISEESKNLKTANLLAIINKVRNKHLVIQADAHNAEDQKVILRKKQVQLDVECPESIEIYTSPSLLEIILNNLVDNAIFYGNLKKSDEAVRVEIKARVHDKILEISVFDNGIGIPKAIWPRIFNMFFTGNEASKGNGLGLYTVKRCVTALQGTIIFDSEEGKFTKFHIILPPLKA